MGILPVLDLMGGQVVRGIAGRRENYRPIVSRLVDSADPHEVALALKDRFGFREMYIADLDAIEGRASDLSNLLHRMRCDGMRIWIDAGLSSWKCPGEVADNTVVGLESVLGPEALAEIVERMGPKRVVFSLDMKAGQPLGRLSAWRTEDPWMIAEKAIALGVERMIVLDLASVGVNDGVSTEELCVRLKQTHPQLQLTTGGGVRDIEDVRRLEAIGVDYVLVASALHDGRITPADVRTG